MKLLTSVILAACCLTFTAAPAYACSNDLVTEVAAGDACFAIDTLAEGDNGTLVVFLHGDGGMSKGGKYWSSYLGTLEPLKQSGARLVVMSRPGGYNLPDKRRTKGIWAEKFDNYTPDIVDGIVEALTALKAGHGASQLILLGHSGGAMISGIIAGRHPGLADAAVLVGFACNKSKWRGWRVSSAGKKNRYPKSLSAHDFIESIPQSFRVRAVTGSKDSNTKAEFAQECIDAMQARGIDATLEIVDGQSHTKVLREPNALNAVLSLM